MLFAQIVSAHKNFICRALQCGSSWVKALHLLHTQVLTQSDVHELYSVLASDADSQTIHISEVIHQLYIMFIVTVSTSSRLYSQWDLWKMNKVKITITIMIPKSGVFILFKENEMGRIWAQSEKCMQL